MNLMQRRLSYLAITAAIGLGVSEAQAQFARTGGFNPYGSGRPADQGPATVPGWNGVPGTQSMFIGTNGAVFPQTSLYGSPNWGSLQLNLFTRTPYFNFNITPPFAPAPRNMYGGTSSSVQSSRTSTYYAPPRTEGSVKAFDRWVNNQQRQERQEDFLKQQKTDDLHRSLTSPSSVDITSGLALNAILDSLESMPEKVKATKAAPIDENFIKQLNFTRGTGSIGMLRNRGKLTWPAMLLRLSPPEEFAKVRGQIESRFQEAFNQVNGGGRADADNIKALSRLIDQLSEMVSGRASSMTFAENLDVKRYMRSLEDSVNFLKQPDAAEWMPGKHKAKPQSVQELVALMGEKGIHFAPALLGDEEAYAKMRRMLATVHLEAAPGK